MKLYRFTLTVEDEVQAETHYQAFLKFRERFTTGFYGPRQEDVQFEDEIPEAEGTTQGE